MSEDGGIGDVAAIPPEAVGLRTAEHDSEENFQLLVNSVRDYAMVLLDPTGHVIGWNPGAAAIKGYSAAEILGSSFSIFYPPEEVARGAPAAHLEAAVAAGFVKYEGWRLRKDGTRFWADVVLTTLFDDEGAVRGFGKVTRDMSERRVFEARLSYQLLHDSLTGLGNRTLLSERLEHALSRRPRRGGKLGLLFVDLDHFKLINDTLGHDIGDEILARTARLLRSAARAEDTIARLGGDEFVVLCEDLVDDGSAETIARRITEAINRPVQVQGHDVFLAASVGVATTDGEQTATEVLRHADRAMYRAKKRGGGCYALLDRDIEPAASKRLALIGALHRALGSDQLRVAYQPLVDLRTGGVRGVEALLRWDHPELGALLPGTFLAVADDIGAIVGFDAWILRTACEQVAEWNRELGRTLGVWVNLSGRSLADARLADTVAAAVGHAGIDPDAVTLEITEGVLMRDAAETVRTLTTLRALGVRLAVDDFGTGYSSLSYLQRFPVHALKVDLSFVARLDGEPTDAHGSAAIVKAVANLAGALEMGTVAEGIETPHQLAAVTSLGCDVGQGYLLGRPAPAAETRLNLLEGVVLPGSTAAHA